MPSPFPGMDPYIECYANWQDFHNTLIAGIGSSLGLTLPPDYYSRIEERFETIGASSEENWFRPDRWMADCDDPVDEVHETWLEIRRLPDLDLVTTIEVLSPSIKLGPGRETYLEKRRQLHAKKVHLVEIDLLLGGYRLPMKPALSPVDYHAVVGRGEKLPVADVYSWTIHDPLPKIPIPLRSPDPDAEIDLASLVNLVYDRGRYARTLYRNPKLPEGVPLSAEDRDWVEGLAGSMRGGGKTD